MNCIEKPELQRLSPFTPNTFVENNELERRLHDQTQLQNLYPGDQPKNIAFPFDADRKLDFKTNHNRWT